MNCHIRIYVECDSNRHLLSSAKGHFDIQFDTTISFKGHSITNPVFSYGGTNNGPGYIKVFSASNTGTVFSDKKFKAMTYDFTASASDVTSCINKIKNYLGSGTTISGGYQYPVTSGPFTTYTTATHNCFAATAVFADWVGYSALKTIYNNASSYTEYTAYKMYKKYGDSWTPHGYYNC